MKVFFTVAAIMFVSILLVMALCSFKDWEARQWEVYSAAHHCQEVEPKPAPVYILVGKVLVPIEKHRYRCDGGEEIVR